MISRHVLIAASGWLSRVVTVGVQLLAVRIMVKNLGAENFAIFTVLGSLGGWFLLTDLGLGFSIQNLISEKRASGDQVDYVLGLAGLSAIVLLIIFTGVIMMISPWAGGQLLLKFTILSSVEKTQLFLASSLLLMGAGVGSMIYKIWYGEHRGYLSHLFPALASLMGLAGIVISSQIAKEYRLMYSLIAFLGPTAFMPLILLYWKCRGKILTCIAALKTSTTELQKISKKGLNFCFFGLMAAGTLQVDYIIASQLLNAQQIVSYTLYTKIFNLVGFIYSSVLLAIWPVFAELYIKREFIDIKSKIQSSITYGVSIVTICTITIGFLMPVIAKILLPGVLFSNSIGLVVFFGIYQLIRVWTDTFATFLQSINYLKPLIVIVPIQTTISVIAQWKLTGLYGMYGLIIGVTISFIITVFWALPALSHRKLAKVITV